MPSNFLEFLNLLVDNGYMPFYDTATSSLTSPMKNIIKIPRKKGSDHVSVNDFFTHESGMFDFLLKKNLFNKYSFYVDYPGFLDANSNEGLCVIFNNCVNPDTKIDTLLSCIIFEKLRS